MGGRTMFMLLYKHHYYASGRPLVWFVEIQSINSTAKIITELAIRINYKKHCKSRDKT